MKENLPETDMWSVKPTSADKWTRRIGMINFVLFDICFYKCPILISNHLDTPGQFLYNIHQLENKMVF